ncbi:hypothetical protein Tco_0980267, partial [Tanacetum coccineum]
KANLPKSQVSQQESSSKRARDELEQESTKKQKIDKDKETTDLQSVMEVIPEEEEIAVDAMPLATKPPTIVDYKIIKEGKINNYQIIRVDGSSKRKHGWMTFMNGSKEVTFKTPYKDQKRNELTSEGHDLLSSRIILSEDDYDRRCERSSDLESMFYKDVDKLGREYQTRPEESSSGSDVNNQRGVTTRVRLYTKEDLKNYSQKVETASGTLATSSGLLSDRVRELVTASGL